MSRGHVTGNKEERKGSSDWYKQLEAENLKRIEAAWAIREAAKQQAGQK